MKTVYLVRHGESESNVGPIFKGDAAKLTPKGYEQAKFIAERCTNLTFDAIIASPLVRTKETAQIISERTGVRVEYSELFKEIFHTTEKVGLDKSSERFRKLDQDWYDNIVKDPAWHLPGGESFNDLHERATAALQYLAKRSEERLLVVGHGAFSRLLLGKIVWKDTFTAHDGLTCLRTFVSSNTGLSELRFDLPEPWAPEWQIVVWNDRAHLG